MFKFNFNVEEDDASDLKAALKEKDEEKPPCKKSKEEEEPVFSHESERILISEKLLENFDVYKLNALEYKVGDCCLQYVLTGFLLEDAQTGDNEDTTDIKAAEKSNSDLIPGVYEGGAKIWECTDDLLHYLNREYTKDTFDGKSVLDLGCGSGLLGIYAFVIGANVHFQDYNKDVLETITIPNVMLNAGDPESEEPLDMNSLNGRTSFYSGDWAAYSRLTTEDEQKFDYILTSETIYNPQNQQKLLDTFDSKLTTKGVVMVAAKTYYFGVGGGLRQFEELIKKDGRFVSLVKWSSAEGVCREILELKRS